MQKGEKDDDGKPRWDLIPFKGLEEGIKVLEFGAKKYKENNWRSVENAEKRYASAALRHIASLLQGEQPDAESGLPHSAHALCCCLFLAELSAKNKP